MSNLSIDRQLPAYVPGAGSTALTPSPTGGVNFAQSLAQVQATPPNWLTGADAARAARPNVREFMDQSGADFETASELLYGVVGSNTDVRDWKSIMASADPISAARAATGQMYNQESVGHVPDAVFASDTNTLARSGNFALVQTRDDQGKVDYQGLNLIAKNGLMLRDAGATPGAIARNAWLFGFDMQPLRALETKASQISASLSQSIAAASAPTASSTPPSAAPLSMVSVAAQPQPAPVTPSPAITPAITTTSSELDQAFNLSDESLRDPFALTAALHHALGESAQAMAFANPARMMSADL